MNTSDIRDSYSQRLYRGYSSSNYKEEKEVGHIYSLELAKYIQSHVPGPVPIESLKDSLNDFDNYRMVNYYTNRTDHREIDQSLIEKYETGEVLTQREEHRARMQVKFAQGNPDIPDGHYNGMIKFYKGLNTQDGSTLWDLRKG